MDDLVVTPVRARVLIAAVVAAVPPAAAVFAVTAAPLAEQVVLETLLFLAAVPGYNLFNGTTGYSTSGTARYTRLGAMLLSLPRQYLE